MGRDGMEGHRRPVDQHDAELVAAREAGRTHLGADGEGLELLDIPVVEQRVEVERVRRWPR